MPKSNLTLSLDQLLADWFRDHCAKHNTKMSGYFNAWVKNFKDATEEPLYRKKFLCKFCGHIFSEMDYRKNFMKCPKCGKLVIGEDLVEDETND